jgi:hypothetical protein
VVVDGREETSVAAVWVTDGMERCRVGFPQRHMVKHVTQYDGAGRDEGREGRRRRQQ